MKSLRQRPTPRSRNGTALIVVLLFIVMLTGMVLLYFSRTFTGMQLSNNSISQFKADELSKSAINIVMGDLKQEIINGSTAVKLNTGVNQVTYTPTQPAYLLPARHGGSDAIPNLVRYSVRSDPDATPRVGSLASASASTTTSANGRSVSLARWNKHYLIPLKNASATATDTTPVGDFTAPDWVFLTTQGPQVLTTPSKAVIGRYAFAVYDESGLLDLNIAGCPSAATTDQKDGKGYLAYADLTALGLQPSEIDNIVGWRNYASAQPSGNFSGNFTLTASSAAGFSTNVLTSTNGFLAVGQNLWNNRTDQAFLNRQQLIDFFNAKNLNRTALQYLGTFSRDVDQPSYAPATPTATNTNTITLQVIHPFNRLDNTPALIGDPLLKHRFPLSRLALFQNPAANSALILKYFAMKQANDGLWDYYDPDNSGSAATTLPTIKTLAAVAQTTPGREPNFWELLQEGILTGSLGLEQTASLNCATTQNLSPTRQLFEIGLSLIDQYDADDTPTVLRFGGVIPPNLNDLFVSGDENLPYIFWIAQQAFRDTITPGTPATNSNIDSYFMFGLWNPHRNAATATPGTFRIRVAKGKSQLYIQLPGAPSGNPYGTPGPAVDNGAASTTLQFQTTAAANANFSTISPLTRSYLSPGHAGTTPATAFFPPSAVNPQQVGILLGTITTVPTTTIPLNAHTTILSTTVPPTPYTLVLEKLVGTSNWIPYEVFPQMAGISGSAYGNSSGLNWTSVTAQMNAGTFNVSGTAPPIDYAMVHSDPRSNRFGIPFSINAPVMAGNGFNIITAAGAAIASGSSGTAHFTPTTITPADYAYNQGPGTASYSDPDGVTRRADGNPPVGTSSHTAAYSPYLYGDARPVMLNRPFKSVAEMGYAFRDDPWRSLDFSTKNSADAGLLDLFCLNENSNALRAGVVNLNSASQPVLAALLSGAYRDPTGTNNVPAYSALQLADAQAIAKAIQAQLGSAANPTLVISNTANLAALTDAVAASLPDTLKFKREAVPRAFADVTNARTWNLMIDVVTQSGRFTPTARSPDDFIVEGERRYWVHVAIDRLTGKVIDTQIEPVFE